MISKGLVSKGQYSKFGPFKGFQYSFWKQEGSKEGRQYSVLGALRVFYGSFSKNYHFFLVSLESSANLDISLHWNAFYCFNTILLELLGFGVLILKKIKVQEGSPWLIFSRPKGLLRVTHYLLNFGQKIAKIPLMREYWKKAFDP